METFSRICGALPADIALLLWHNAPACGADNPGRSRLSGGLLKLIFRFIYPIVRLRLRTAQTLRITEPKDGTLVYAGKTLTVVVDAAPALAFREMIIIGQDPIGFSQMLTAPPYRFSMLIPPNTRPRRYKLRADGSTEPGRGATSDPAEILVERSDSPLSLTAEPSTLDFQYVGDQCPLAAVGRFIDAELVYLDESSYVRYVSDNPRVATVTSDGHVSAGGPGATKITIRYNGKSAVVPVIVRQPRPEK